LQGKQHACRIPYPADTPFPFSLLLWTASSPLPAGAEVIFVKADADG
jgi:hypothetical protein